MPRGMRRSLSPSGSSRCSDKTRRSPHWPVPVGRYRIRQSGGDDWAMPDKRRTQAERAAETRDALIAAARPLFASPGFADVALETIVRDAGVTRGALYHHFADKTELFAAVLERVEGEMAARMGEAIVASNQTDPVAIMRLGVDFWLDASSDPEVQRIVLVAPPAVLGWARWTEIGN